MENCQLEGHYVKPAGRRRRGGGGKTSVVNVDLSHRVSVHKVTESNQRKNSCKRWREKWKTREVTCENNVKEAKPRSSSGLHVARPYKLLDM